MTDTKKLRVVYTYPVGMSFVRNDEALLRQHFIVHAHHFKQVPRLLPLSFLRQLFVLLWHLPSTDIYVSFFAGYSTVLPTIFSKLFRRPHVIILGGTDCVSFPEIGYGNYRKRFLGAATRYSIRHASHLAPVDASLVEVSYTYMDVVNRVQGYKTYCHPVNVPYSVIPIGYDKDRFYYSGPKKRNSFLTVGQMNAANYYRKGVDLIFFLARAYPDCTFTIVGHSDSMRYPESVPDNVQLVPFVPYESLREIYASHEFYLQLSLMEGFPSAPCEAMLCGCIPVVSSVAALPGIVGDAGFVLRSKDKDQLRQLIDEALAVDRPTAAAKAREQIMAHFPITTRMALVDLVRQVAVTRKK